jgi:hypothetical protein
VNRLAVPACRTQDAAAFSRVARRFNLNTRASVYRMGTRVLAALLLLTAGCKSDKKEEAPAAATSGGKVALLLP